MIADPAGLPQVPPFVRNDPGERDVQVEADGTKPGRRYFDPQQVKSV